MKKKFQTVYAYSREHIARVDIAKTMDARSKLDVLMMRRIEMTPNPPPENELMPDVIYAGKNEDGYVTISEKVWDDYNTNCAVKYIRAATAPKQDDIAERLSAAEKLIAVFMEFRFLREDWKVKEALAAYEQRGGA